MKYETYQYDRIFEILKHKIESGRMPKGTVLPSIADLCREYKVSNKTIRRVVAMLADAGLIKTKERQLSVVILTSIKGKMILRTICRNRTALL